MVSNNGSSSEGDPYFSLDRSRLEASLDLDTQDNCILSPASRKPDKEVLDGHPLRISQLKSQSSLFFGSEGPFPQRTSLKDEKRENERNQLLMRKIKDCMICYSFVGENYQQDKENKRFCLQEVCEYITNFRNKIPSESLRMFFKMISMNLFRTIGPPPSFDNYDPDEDDPIYDTSWSHLQYVYIILLTIIQSPRCDMKILKELVTQDFIIKVIRLLRSLDQREREYVKNLIHRIYGRFLVHRAFIRREMQYILYRYLYDNIKFFGVDEILEVYESIINGLAVPIKEEHVKFLFSVIIPLHSMEFVSSFHNHLTSCIILFVEKDNSLVERVVRGLLRQWPKSKTEHELLFLSELEDILSLSDPANFERVMIPVFRKLARAVKSQHYQVAERALLFWNNEYVVNMVYVHREVIFPLLVPSLLSNSNHWNESISKLSQELLNLFNKLDSQHLEDCIQRSRVYEMDLDILSKSRHTKWEKIEEIASKKR